MTTITCKLSDALDAKLEALAQKRGVSKSEIVRDSLERTVGSKMEKSSVTLLDLMRDCCGLIKKAPSDLATHPRHLEDFGK